MIEWGILAAKSSTFPGFICMALRHLRSFLDIQNASDSRQIGASSGTIHFISLKVRYKG